MQCLSIPIPALLWHFELIWNLSACCILCKSITWGQCHNSGLKILLLYCPLKKSWIKEADLWQTASYLKSSPLMCIKCWLWWTVEWSATTWCHVWKLDTSHDVNWTTWQLSSSVVGGELHLTWICSICCRPFVHQHFMRQFSSSYTVLSVWIFFTRSF